MRKNLVGGLAVTAALIMTAPAWANGGYGHGNGHGYGHGHGHGHHWNKHHAHERVVIREYVRPVPVYPGPVSYPAYRAPAAGIHIVFPGVFIPFR
jgi:hypothetical protein